MRHKVIAGIDMGTYTTRVVVCEVREDGGKPRILGMGSSPTRGLRHGYVVSRYDAVQSLVSAIAEAEKHSRVPVSNAYVAMGGVSLASHVVSHTFDIKNAGQEVSQQDIDMALSTMERLFSAQYQNRRPLHMIPISYELDGVAIPGAPFGLTGRKLFMKALCVSAFSHHIEDLSNVIASANIAVKDIVASPIALADALLSPRQRTAGCLVADIGAETVSLVVFEHDVPVSLEVLPIGSTDITNDIALGFQIPIDKAENLKIGKPDVSFSKKKIDSIIAARLEDIFELIEQHLKKINRSGLLPAGVVICGGGSQLARIDELTREHLRLPAQVIKSEYVQLVSQQKIKMDASWFAAYGLCLREGNFGDASGDILQSITSFFKSLGRKLGDNLIP